MARKNFAAALDTAERIASESEWDEVAALGSIAVAQAQAGDPDAALHTAERIPDESRGWYEAAALGSIAAAQARAGDPDAARATCEAALRAAERISREWRKAAVLGSIAAAQAQAGLGEIAARTAQSIPLDQNKHLPDIVTALAKAGEQAHFKRLLPLCADYLDAAYRMSGLLAQLYPNQAAAIADVVART